jgi:hypothetical protein
VDYKQTRSKEEALAFIEATKDDSVYEVVIRGNKKDIVMPRKVEIYIEGKLQYKIDPVTDEYWCANIGNFYLSKGEGWYLAKYLETYAEGGVTPSWWAQVYKNIRRHENPTSYFRSAVDAGLDVTIKFVE